MKYILDFDRTILDTDSLKRKQAEMFGPEVLGTLDSMDGIDIESFFFADAVEFLNTHNMEDIYIVTSCVGITGMWNIEYQKKKLKISGIYKNVNQVFVVSESKDKAIKSIPGVETGAVFVDDFTNHLDVVKYMLPDIETVKITRKDVLKSEEKSKYKHKEIKLLTELDAIIGL